MSVDQSTYQRRKSAGLCVYCGRRQAAKGRVRCSPCAAYFRERAATPEAKEYHRRYYEKQRAAAIANRICTNCWKRDAKRGRKCCEQCLKEANEKSSARFHQRRGAGQCTACGVRPAEGDGGKCGLCGKCWDRWKGTYRRYRKRKRNDIARCLECGKHTPPGWKYCQACLEAKRPDGSESMQLA